MSRIINMITKIKERWNEIDMQAVEEFRRTKRPPKPGAAFKHPQRKKFEAFRMHLDKICGKGATYILIACFAVLLFLLNTGGSGIIAAFGIALATCFGAALVISRFPSVRKFVLDWFKWIDLAAFVIAFSAANTIFGFQVAAIIGIMITAALILWNYQAKKNDPEYNVTEADVKSAIRNLIKQMGEEYERTIYADEIRHEVEAEAGVKHWYDFIVGRPQEAPATV